MHSILSNEGDEACRKGRQTYGAMAYGFDLRARDTGFSTPGARSQRLASAWLVIQYWSYKYVTLHTNRRFWFPLPSGRGKQVGRESKWDAKRENFTSPKIDLPHNLYDNFIVNYVQYYIIIKID